MQHQGDRVSDSKRQKALRFRRKLIRRLNEDGAKFDFSAVARGSGLNAEWSARVAELVFSQFFEDVVEDGEITDRERRKLQLLAKRLEMSGERQAAIEGRLAKKSYRDRLRKAEADGVITDEEREELRQLRSALGLSAATVPRRPASNETRTVAEAETESQLARIQEEDRIAERDGILALVKSSPQYERRDSPQRLERARAVGQKRKLFLFASAVLLSCIAVVCGVTLAWVGNSTEDAKILLGIASIAGMAFCGIPSLLLWFFCWRIHRRRSLPISSSALMVVSKRAARKKSTRHGSEEGRFYYAMFEGDGGRRIEYELCDPAFAERLFVGDAGVLFVQENMAIDFDCVHTAETTRERHIQGAVICSSCQTVFELDQVPTNCRNCGAALPKSALSKEDPVERRNVAAVFGGMERWSERIWQRQGMLHEIGGPTLKHRVEGHVTCGWCRHRYELRPDSSDCVRCGGVLPMPPGHDRGPKPPPPPRKLPREFYSVVYWKSNGVLKTGLMILAAGFCCICLAPVSLILLFCGFMSVVYGLIVARRRIAALGRGVALPGQIENIQWIGSLPTQEKGTRRVFYRFEAEGEPLRAMFYSYDSSIEDRFTGEPIWVVAVPGKPHLCAAWPPFA